MQPHNMASLTLKGISSELLDKLRARAESERRSLNQQAILMLEEAVSPSKEGFAASYATFLKSHGPSPLTDDDLSGLRSSDRDAAVNPFDPGVS